MKYPLRIRATGLFVLFALLAFNFGPWGITPAQAGTVTIVESFAGTTAPGWTLLGARLTAPSPDPDGSGWMRLTGAATNQVGAVFYDTPISTELDVVEIQFDYATYGGTHADGLTFFMIDGIQTPTAPGNSGGGLGYTGLPGAFFAVGFDEYGYFGEQAPLTPNVAIRDSINVLNSVLMPVETGSRLNANHVKIVFDGDFVSVSLNGTPISGLQRILVPSLLPSTVKIGFSAATGGRTNIHEIRNLRVDLKTFGTWRVTEDGTTQLPCGAVWEVACSLQTALANAESGDELWVAEGLYKPSLDPADPTFRLAAGVAVYGGFEGMEVQRSERDPRAHLAILSGDIGGDDANLDGNHIDETTADIMGTNSIHVVTGADGATLDGFTVTAGNASGDATGTPLSKVGGGMYNASRSPTVTNVSFIGNLAKDSGGGMFNLNSDPLVTEAIFSGNRANNNGGGMYNNSSSPTITNVTFQVNTSGYGGGMYNIYSSPTVTKVTFHDNSAASGGGMYNNYGWPTITNVTFSGNSAQEGGGMENESSHPTVTNATFSGNRATGAGGGMYTHGLDDLYLSEATVRNSLFWGNTGPGSGSQLGDGPNGYSLVSDSVVQGGCAISTNCTHIINADPRLGALGDHGGFTPTQALFHGSAAIDTGSLPCPLTDQRGVTRPQGGACDIGAFEGELYPVFLPMAMNRALAP